MFAGDPLGVLGGLARDYSSRPLTIRGIDNLLRHGVFGHAQQLLSRKGAKNAKETITTAVIAASNATVNLLTPRAA